MSALLNPFRAKTGSIARNVFGAAKEEKALVALKSGITDTSISTALSLIEGSSTKTNDVKYNLYKQIINRILSETPFLRELTFNTLLDGYLRFGTPSDTEYQRILSYACKMRYVEPVRSLLASIPPTLLTSLQNISYIDHTPTPLHMACKGGSKEIVTMLLEKGITPNQTDEKGRTPLFYLINKRKLGKDLSIIDDLVKQGAKLDETDNSGKTALMVAIIEEDKEVEAYLTGLGADQTIRNRSSDLAANNYKRMQNNRVRLGKMKKNVVVKKPARAGFEPVPTENNTRRKRIAAMAKMPVAAAPNNSRRYTRRSRK